MKVFTCIKLLLTLSLGLPSTAVVFASSCNGTPNSDCMTGSPTPLGEVRQSHDNTTGPCTPDHLRSKSDDNYSIGDNKKNNTGK